MLSVLETLVYFLNKFSNAARASFGREACRNRSFLLMRDANLVKFAVIAYIFFRYPHRNRLHALETASGIEIRALLARVQFKLALWTLSRRSGSPEERFHTAHTARPRAFRAYSPGAAQMCCLFFGGGLPAPDRSPVPFRSLFAIAILIPVLTVFRHSILPKHAACIVDPMPLNRQVLHSPEVRPLQWKHDPRNYSCGTTAVQLLDRWRRGVTREAMVIDPGGRH